MTTEEKHVSIDRPWLMPEVINWLELRPMVGRVVLETGAGGSTIFFASLGATVICYENDGAWAEKVRGEAVRRGLAAHVIMRCRPNYPAQGLNPLTTAPTPFDYCFIDGRGRVRSVLDALPNLKPGGWLILDDSDRPHYAEARRVMDEAAAARIVFRSGPDETTAWRKR